MFIMRMIRHDFFRSQVTIVLAHWPDKPGNEE